MSSVKTWFTKEEVLKDLAKVSGRRVARVGHLDKSHMVIGDGPPPVLFESKDDEMQNQFGDVIRERGTVQYDDAPPDLEGITNMIRMVQGSDGEGDHEETNNFGQTSNCVIAISKPSKLNPHVKEFVPKGSLSSNSSSSLSEAKAAGDGDAKPNKEQVKTNGTTSKGNIIDVENVTPNICEDLATKLKNDISNASKSNSFELKKQKNVAIATLLRLYATNNNKSPPKPKEPVKLITPDYYENPSPTKELENTQGSSTTTPDPKSMTSSALSGSSSDVKSEPALSTQNKQQSPVKPVLDPAIKKSIEKVNQWMGAPVERESPKVFLAPVTFKRKDPAGTVVSSTSETEQKNVYKHNKANEYKPSNYAADLGRKYMERSKTKEKQNVNMWTDLDVILKERDAIIIKKKMEASSDSNNDSDAPCN